MWFQPLQEITWHWARLRYPKKVIRFALTYQVVPEILIISIDNSGASFSLPCNLKEVPFRPAYWLQTVIDRNTPWNGGSSHRRPGHGRIRWRGLEGWSLIVDSCLQKGIKEKGKPVNPERGKEGVLLRWRLHLQSFDAPDVCGPNITIWSWVPIPVIPAGHCGAFRPPIPGDSGGGKRRQERIASDNSLDFMLAPLIYQVIFGTRSWVCFGAFSARIRGFVRVEVERGCF